MFVPVSGLTDEAVLEFPIGRWDHQLLKANNVSMKEYDDTRVAYNRLSKASKAETAAMHKERYLVQKRLLITTLLELRAAADTKHQKANTSMATAQTALVRVASDGASALALAERLADCLRSQGSSLEETKVRMDAATADYEAAFGALQAPLPDAQADALPVPSSAETSAAASQVSGALLKLATGIAGAPRARGRRKRVK